MKRSETINKIIDFFNENTGIFNDCIEKLDSYGGYLGDERYYTMDDLDEFYSNEHPTEILFRAFYGHDDDTWTTDEHGEKHYGEFNPNREYFYYNGYGNLVSSDYKDYTDHIDKYIIEKMSENRIHVDSIEEDDELAALFDELEQDEEGEE